MARKPLPQATRRLFDATLTTLDALVPDTWSVVAAQRTETGGSIAITAPGDLRAEVAVLVLDGLSPRDAVALPEPEAATVVAASWLSPRTRDILSEGGLGYVDQTGNVRLTVDRPPMVFRADGAGRNPTAQPAQGPSLRGPRAWALMRTLAEVQPPYGVSDLAASLGMDAGYVSRLLAALTDELLVTRAPRGPVEHVEWEALLRQLATTYSLRESNDTTNWLASAGPDQFLQDLAAGTAKGWAVTGSFAASELVSVAAPEVAIVYADDPERLVDLTRLRQVRNGGNVVIARPYDRIVFDRTWRRNDLTYCAPAQVVVDCLTGPARMPAEGEALLGWLRKRASRWQASSLASAVDFP